MANYSNVTINPSNGKASVTIDGISFNSINLADGYKSISQAKIAPQRSIFDPEGGTNKSLIINAVDIDWNSAVIPNGDIENGTSETINTTGELLSLINKMQEEIYVLSAA